MATTATRWADYLQGIPPLAQKEQSSAALFHLTTASIFGPEVVIKRTSCPDDVAREEEEADARAWQDKGTIFRSWGWETEVNPQGGYDVYVFYPPYMLHSVYDEINLLARMKDYFSEELMWGLFRYLFYRTEILSCDLKLNLLFYSSSHKYNSWYVCDLGFGRLPYDSDPSEFQLYNDTYSSLKQHQLATLSAKGLKESKNYVFLAGFMLLHLSLLSLPRLELEALQQSMDQNLLLVEENYSEKWVKMLRAILEPDEALRPNLWKLSGLLGGRGPPYSLPPLGDDKSDLFGSDFDLDSEW